VHATGAWVILDEYIYYDNTIPRNLIFIIIGILLMALSGLSTVIVNASVEPFNEQFGIDLQDLSRPRAQSLRRNSMALNTLPFHTQSSFGGAGAAAGGQGSAFQPLKAHLLPTRDHDEFAND
jgi:hypothetical protein